MNHETDRLNELKFTQYYQLNSVPETMLLTEAEHSILSDKINHESKTAERAVILGLGIISTLLFLSGIQLQRSVNIVPSRIENSPTVRKFKKVLNTSPKGLSQQQNHKLESLAHKNSISQGRF
jgi:hypothetical protein